MTNLQLTQWIHWAFEFIYFQIWQLRVIAPLSKEATEQLPPCHHLLVHCDKLMSPKNVKEVSWIVLGARG